MPEEILHVRQLADVIGPRPATTDTEAEAAGYLEGVFRRRGLDVERQEFLCPRTDSWAFVVYHLLTIAAAAASGALPELLWPALGVSVLTAALMWFDLDSRFGLSSVMPKGPSQNVIARHVPKARRGERVRRVVVVAHYDSAKASLAASPGMVRNHTLTFALMKYATFLVPVFILAQAVLPAALDPWLWYATMAIAAYLVVPASISVHRELAMPFVDGANDNASGVAALLGVMERVVPEPLEERSRAPEREPAPRAEEEDLAEEAVPADALLTYSPAHAPEAFDESFAEDLWSGETGPIAGQRSLLPEAGEEEPSDGDGSQGRSRSERTEERPRRRGLFGRRRGEADEERRGVRDWLGVGRAFDAREEGRNIGSWENFSDDDEEGFGFKGGRASYDALDDPRFAAEEASRIRRRVTERIDRGLADKEVWFVATGAEEAGCWGMRALLEAHGDELREATVINIDNVGSGNVSWVTEEGMARRHRGDRRLASIAKRVAREQELPVRSRAYGGLSSDAVPALARGYKAMSVMAFDINGRLPDRHWKTDTTDNVSEDNLRVAAEFVTALIREL
ncbi:MAG: M28 family peptidase [Coriobacteriia bacterium]|nr:M28 family peptidase [Coriobacteriia bacterium]